MSVEALRDELSPLLEGSSEMEFHSPARVRSKPTDMPGRAVSTPGGRSMGVASIQSRGGSLPARVHKNLPPHVNAANSSFVTHTIHATVLG